jgi:hypothetical protein
MAWQCQLFYFSCISRLNHTPIIIVHQSGKEWAPGFIHITKAGGIVRSAPSYGTDARGNAYPPRNTAGTLLHATDMNFWKDDFFVLCDPDMLFIRKPRLLRTLAAERYSYLDYSKRDVQAAARNFSLDPSLVLRHERKIRCGVPYVIPVQEAERLARVWLDAIDAFKAAVWERSMYAFGLALLKLGLDIGLMQTTETNFRPRGELKRAVLHYCYGDRRWSKRRFWTKDKAPEVWKASGHAPRGTPLGELFHQIKEARDFYASPDIWRS